jgi:4-aminobutyrate aminotransferase-like enzyme
MDLFKQNPILGHITTFGGHPVIAAAAHSNLKETLSSNIMSKIEEKENLIRRILKHKLIIEIRGKGLMLALILKKPDLTKKLVEGCLDNGLILFYLLFEPKAVRITPPLTISKNEIKKGCKIILSELDKIEKHVH